MQDRVATYPNRWKLMPVTGETNVYDFERADEPVVAGTPLNKATFLTNETAAAIAEFAGSTPTLPTEALSAIAAFINEFGDVTKTAYIETGSYVGTGIISSLTSQSGDRVNIKNISSAPSLTFSFKPRFLFIKTQTTTSYKYYNSSNSQLLFDPTILGPENITGTNGLLWIYPFTNIGSRGFIVNGNTIKWFYSASTSTAADLLNTSGTTYYYLAIGVN